MDEKTRDEAIKLLLEAIARGEPTPSMMAIATGLLARIAREEQMPAEAR